jgi:hypothetical protein
MFCVRTWSGLVYSFETPLRRSMGFVPEAPRNEGLSVSSPTVEMEMS